ncbi:amine sulfotransferase-like [Tachyglossus aculeatus]|uniref:amine sulfotransferase-like n=1 Tax=Tachyglossus aculeatus TaxID=9261 RepID=UPI0018F4ABED|nr:amine sulfotransferase-like [Tachyglossus aculeatus]XP_038597716.1 amine sulfotransferase-like [Tachyglossus aculeatus]
MAEEQTAEQRRDLYVLRFKDFNFMRSMVNPEFLEIMEDFEIRDNDIFIATYPKSGTVWTQQVVNLILSDEHRNGMQNLENIERAPWLEYNLRKANYTLLPSPRVFSTHLPYNLLPKGVQSQKVKVIYVYRNPKDVMTSFYHFSKLLTKLQTSDTMEDFMERFLAGDVLANLWFDHIKGWYSHKNNFNILFLTYEEMKKDLRNAVLKISKFLGKKLTDEDVESVVKQATFENMKNDPRANYDAIARELGRTHEQDFLRKGIIGDWKNCLTVSQSERFDKVFQEQMKDLPLKFIWDMNEDL